MKHEQATTPGCRGRGACGVVVALAGALVCLSPARAAVTEDNFLARTTDDVVALCSAAQSDPLYSASIHFCHGFAVGSYQVLHEFMAAEPKFRLFCATEPGPSRNESIATFLTWVKAHPEQGAKVPAESVAAFLADRYPCPPVSASQSRPAKKH